MKIRNILFPTDFSCCSEHAFDHAVRFAQEYGAQLHIFHLTVLLVDDPMNPAFHCRDTGKYEQQAREATDGAMVNLLRRHNLEGVEIKLVQRQGVSASSAILEYIEHGEVDLVVMGTHGHRGIAKAVLGSVAAKVVQLGSCPVMTLCEKRGAGHLPEVHRLVVPIDFSVPSERALALSGSIAERFGATIDLVHVIENYSLPAFYGPWPRAWEDLKILAMDELLELRDQQRELLPKTVEVEAHVLESRRASHGIVNFAKDRRADGIVIASEGLTGLPRVFIGGTAQRIISLASCPVLTVKAWAHHGV
ncbi:MAG: universal stress protein [Deltaproteobacteria bacterium]|nr:universal stress protein [Deltaproteobacteria bacterium]